jgi:hypothetical protein
VQSTDRDILAGVLGKDGVLDFSASELVITSQNSLSFPLSWSRPNLHPHLLEIKHYGYASSREALTERTLELFGQFPFLD